MGPQPETPFPCHAEFPLWRPSLLLFFFDPLSWVPSLLEVLSQVWASLVAWKVCLISERTSSALLSSPLLLEMRAQRHVPKSMPCWVMPHIPLAVWCPSGAPFQYALVHVLLLKGCHCGGVCLGSYQKVLPVQGQLEHGLGPHCPPQWGQCSSVSYSSHVRTSQQVQGQVDTQCIVAEWPETSRRPNCTSRWGDLAPSWLSSSGVHPCVANTRPPASRLPQGSLLNIQTPRHYLQGFWFSGSDLGQESGFLTTFLL